MRIGGLLGGTGEGLSIGVWVSLAMVFLTALFAAGARMEAVSLGGRCFPLLARTLAPSFPAVR